MLERVYICDNQGRIQPIDAYEGARDFAEDVRHSERVGDVSDRRDTT